jgi:cobalamin synthase
MLTDEAGGAATRPERCSDEARTALAGATPYAGLLPWRFNSGPQARPMAQQLHLLLAALRVYTRFPFIRRAPGAKSDDTARARDALRYLPLAGLLVAIAQSVVYMLASVVLPHAVALLLAIGAGLILTGACHEVGWARFCATLGERPAARDAKACATDSVTDSVTDSATDSATDHTTRSANSDPIDAAGNSASAIWALQGAIGVMLLLMLRFESLAHLDTDWIAASLICAATFSRACAVLGSPRASPTDALIAMLLGAAPLALLAIWTDDHLPGLLGLSIALISTALVRRLIRRSGSMDAGTSDEHGTGFDTATRIATRTAARTATHIGAVQQIAEAGFLIGLLIALEAGPDDTLSTDDEMDSE